ncbi:hypothetical protein A3D11_03010 [Candidatus Peribacteria bacterium RIFCSPHIGHO2_02_FULL_49_16]|nr:MAG: hypothetical protein A2880_01550 [Candidatus Peribacteria bacterium RIFCSPHIGHO2_01_FULL_49_38]OGJ58553.1 MAG: hypothetical protein A3D11_03010 [Candidatus Peribacteria bacterium RIFCSPHIGHO2_02_FULL_49_16]
MKAVIFDFDGVIVDSEKYWDEAMNAFGQAHINGWQQGDNSRLFSGMTLEGCFAKLCEHFGVHMTLDEFKNHMCHISENIYHSQASLLPNVHALITDLHEKNIPLAIASSSKRVWIDIATQRLNIHHFFYTSTTGDEIPHGEGKPKPTIYLRTAERLNMDPRDCIAIEDARHGIYAAKNAGMTCVGLRNGFNVTQDLSFADHILEGFLDVTTETLRAIHRTCCAAI